MTRRGEENGGGRGESMDDLTAGLNFSGEVSDINNKDCRGVAPALCRSAGKNRAQERAIRPVDNRERKRLI